MKQYILAAAMAALTLQGVMAADSTGAENRFYINPYQENEVVINPKTHMGEVEVWLDNETDNFNSFIIDFYLPEGFTVQTNSRGKYVVSVPNDEKTYDHTVGVTDRGTFYRFLGYSPTQEWISTGDDLLFSFNIVAPADFKGTAHLEMKNIQLASGNTVANVQMHNMDDQSYIVADEDNATGIETVEAAADADTTPTGTYDLQGRRVTRPTAPGLYIINGRKVIK